MDATARKHETLADEFKKMGEGVEGFEMRTFRNRFGERFEIYLCPFLDTYTVGFAGDETDWVVLPLFTDFILSIEEMWSVVGGLMSMLSGATR